MTSNAGPTTRAAWLASTKDAKAVTKEKAMKGLSSFLRPEFMARVDEIVVFNPLSRGNLKDIAKLMLEEMRKPLEDLGLGLQYDEKALEVLADKSQNGKFAARDLRSTIRREVEDKISMLVISTMKNKKNFVSADEKGYHRFDDLVLKRNKPPGTNRSGRFLRLKGPRQTGFPVCRGLYHK